MLCHQSLVWVGIVKMQNPHAVRWQAERDEMVPSPVIGSSSFTILLASASVSSCFGVG